MKHVTPFSVTTNLSPEIGVNFAYCVRDANGWEVAYIPGIRGEKTTEQIAADVAAIPDLKRALKEATDAYEDLLKKYGRPHLWGLISVAEWRKTLGSEGNGDGSNHTNSTGDTQAEATGHAPRTEKTPDVQR